MENLSFFQSIKPSKKLLKIYLVWFTINLVVIFFTYNHLGNFYYSGKRTPEYGKEVSYKTYDIWVINHWPDKDEFWPFHGLWVKKDWGTVTREGGSWKYDKYGELQLVGGTQVTRWPITFYGLFSKYDISEFIFYTLGVALIYFIIKTFIYLSRA